jgi:endonuclease/exonuclease/phosphatase (EEP) superfamily protein YafD
MVRIPAWLYLLLKVIGGIVLVLAAVGFVLRWLPLSTAIGAIVVALLPVMIVPLLITAACFGLARSARWTLVTLFLTVLVIAPSMGTLFRSAPSASGGTSYVVMSSNLKFGHADPKAIVAAVRKYHVDILAVQELTYAERDRLAQAGLGALLPAQTFAGESGLNGIGIYSRFSATILEDPPRVTHFSATVRVAVPDAAPVLVATVHLNAPLPGGVGDWRRDLKTLGQWMNRQHGEVVVAGDFNSTLDHADFRRLLGGRGKYRDAATQAGVAFVRTYPAQPVDFPLIGLDHALLSGAVTAHGFRTVSISGSDHRAIVVQLSVPAVRRVAH